MRPVSSLSRVMLSEPDSECELPVCHRDGAGVTVSTRIQPSKKETPRAAVIINTVTFGTSLYIHALENHHSANCRVLFASASGAEIYYNLKGHRPGPALGAGGRLHCHCQAEQSSTRSLQSAGPLAGRRTGCVSSAGGSGSGSSAGESSVGGAQREQRLRRWR